MRWYIRIVDHPRSLQKHSIPPPVSGIWKRNWLFFSFFSFFFFFFLGGGGGGGCIMNPEVVTHIIVSDSRVTLPHKGKIPLERPLHAQGNCFVVLPLLCSNSVFEETHTRMDIMVAIMMLTSPGTGNTKAGQLLRFSKQVLRCNFMIDMHVKMIPHMWHQLNK